MKKFIFLLSFIIFNIYFLFSQPIIQWQNSIGGSAFDLGRSIQQTFDEGYIIAGSSFSSDSDATANHGSSDYWIVKLNNAGTIEWQVSLGGSAIDEAYSIQQTIDSGYIIAGYSNSNDGDVSGNNGGNDYWIVKLNSIGVIEWQKSLGGTQNDEAYSIQQTLDTGYIIAGYSSSNDSDVSGNKGYYDCWIVKLNSAGIIQWQKSFGGTGYEEAYSIQQTSDTGYIFTGYSGSNDSDVTGNHGLLDIWIVKLSHNGSIQWQESLGGSVSDLSYAIQQTFDSGFIVAGYSDSNNGDVSGNHGNYDCWVVKLNSAGIIQWQKSFGGSQNDGVSSIQQTNDGSYIVGGVTLSNDSDVTFNHGSIDYWILQLDHLGAIQWKNSLGGTADDEVQSIQQTADGGFVICGYSFSNDGNVTGNNGNYDYWIVKLSAFVNVNEIQNAITNFQIYPNPFSNESIISFEQALSDKTFLEIHDMNGRLIKTLDCKNFRIGSNEVVWNATNNSECKVDDGIYFISILSDKVFETKKVVVLKN